MGLVHTQMGADFFQKDIPKIIKALSSIDESLQEANQLKARELLLKERELDLREQALQWQKRTM